VAKEPNARDAKLIQYLNEAYGKEKELEQALTAHIAMTDPKAYKKRLQDHLKITKAQSRGLGKRIRELGGKPEESALPAPALAAQNVAGRAVAAAKGPLHALRGTGEAEKLLKNAKTELWNENEEIGNYLAIEALAETVGDKETARLAKDYRRQEEQMAKYLQAEIGRLSKAVAREEIPAAERRSSSPRKRRTTRKAASRSSSRSSSRPAAKRSASAGKAATTRGARKTTAAAKSTASSARKTARTAGKTASAAGKTARSAGRAAAKSASASRSSGSRAKKS
jgi:ferritin-like metal-binding protein YciE